jgi:hypothetical protein
MNLLQETVTNMCIESNNIVYIKYNYSFLYNRIKNLYSVEFKILYIHPELNSYIVSGKEPISKIDYLIIPMDVENNEYLDIELKQISDSVPKIYRFMGFIQDVLSETVRKYT